MSYCPAEGLSAPSRHSCILSGKLGSTCMLGGVHGLAALLVFFSCPDLIPLEICWSVSSRRKDKITNAVLSGMPLLGGVTLLERVSLR